MELKIANQLNQLSDLILTDLTEFKMVEPNEGYTIKELYKNVVGKIEEYTQGITQFSYPTNYYLKDITRWQNKEEYLQRVGKKYPLILEILEHLKTEYNLKDPINALFQFINLLSTDNVYHEKSKAVELIGIFLNDIQNIPPNWTIKLWIDGIYLNDDIQITTSQKISIRRPIDEDLTYEKWAFLPDNRDYSHNNIPSAIIEFSVSKMTYHEIYAFIGSLISTLQLFGQANIKVLNQEYIPNSITQFFGYRGISNDKFSQYSYGLNKEDSMPLDQFIKLIQTSMPPQGWKNEESSFDLIFLAIERYFESIGKQMLPENRIAIAITSMEAIYLKSEERSELSHKLSQRASFVLSNFFSSPIKIYKDLKRAYDIIGFSYKNV